MGNKRELDSKSRTILQYIAKGHAYQQILDAYPDLTYMDIFKAAQEAIDIIDKSTIDYNEPTQSLEEIRIHHPRAYEKWDTEEDAKLVALFNSGMKKRNIAETLKRQEGAIQSRLRKLGLIE